jgi:hypothetical protein
VVSDLKISCGKLYQAQNDIQNLSPEISRIQNTVRAEGRGATYETVPGQVNSDNTDLGPGLDLFRALGNFYANWSSPMSNAADGLNKLAGYYKGIADTFMKVDASTAAGINSGAAISAAESYPLLLDQYDTELYWAINPKTGKRMYADPKLPPPPNDGNFSIPGTGMTTSYTMAGIDPKAPKDYLPGDQHYKPPALVSSETTTVTVNGMTYSETTKFGPDQGWGDHGGPTQNYTQVVTNPDGSTDSLTVTTNTSGHGTETDLNSATGLTTTYTRANWKASWVDVTPPGRDTTGLQDPGAAPYEGGH